MQTVNGWRCMRIALTGGIAAGKSTVATRMAEDGADVIDYDHLAHILQEPCSPAIDPLVKAFGPGILNGRGGVDRRILSRHVFGEGAPDNATETLNGIMHPLVYELARNRERSWSATAASMSSSTISRYSARSWTRFHSCSTP